MPSELFKLANRQRIQDTRSVFNRSPVRKLQKELKSIRDQPGYHAVRTLYKRLTHPEVRKIMETLEAGAGVTKYSGREEQKQQLDRLLSLLGPIGNTIRRAIGPKSGSYTQDSYDAAVDLVRAMGGEVLEKKPGTKGYDRGLAAAQQMLEEAGYGVTPPGTREHLDRDQPHLNEELEAVGWLYDQEERVSSSNVYSYAYSQETETTGTLYVTFLAWTPGGGSSNAAGATYAYHNVAPQKYRRFKDAAGRSAGQAVWDFLRVRGSVHGHQHQYELVAGVMVQGAGVYVPRKVTASGFYRRAVQTGVGPRGQWTRSELASRDFRGRPNRGTPGRGTPNRGRG